MSIKRQPTYQAYADIYDDFKGDRSATIHVIMDLIHKYRPAARTALDLACGTGSITQGLPASLAVVGLDNSSRMLRLARRKLPHMHFVLGDMSNFDLGRQFDVIYCLHNSVNHLRHFAQWESLFRAAAHHLPTGGLFIFDINSVDKMENLSAAGPFVYAVGNNYLIAEIKRDERTHEPYAYNWDMKVLKRRRGGYKVYDEPVKVRSFPHDKVVGALAPDFNVVEAFEPRPAAIFDDIGRTYYVCVKK